ncbi:hypothetical protein MVEG_11481 [Podila verticillata NRRL 6337]|uniref:Uncharacterized protein n=1 Tax=Podila verticillata NRRL 6337 TaxID=1069443 RepID=A0A086TJZ3_9FUNG|nr:hypothetical protein MVEG_11481 [Podila verticillata NRRL 6337]
MAGSLDAKFSMVIDKDSAELPVDGKPTTENKNTSTDKPRRECEDRPALKATDKVLARTI